MNVCIEFDLSFSGRTLHAADADPAHKSRLRGGRGGFNLDHQEGERKTGECEEFSLSDVIGQ